MQTTISSLRAAQEQLLGYILKRYLASSTFLLAEILIMMMHKFWNEDNVQQQPFVYE